jgi:hypothetical protein
MTAYQVAMAVTVIAVAMAVAVDLALLIVGRVTISRVIKDRIGSDPTPYWIGFVLGALASHFTNW